MLVCLGGLKYGEIASAVAAKVARAIDAEVSLLHVTPEVHSHHKRMKFGAEAKTASEVLQFLERTKKIFEREGITNIKIVRRKGEPAREILRESEKGYQMVVTGSRGLKGIEKAIFHSVSYQIAEYATIPVLVVKRNVEIKKILVCTDGSENAKEAEFCAGILAKALDAEITLISVAWEYEDPEVAEKCDLEGKRFLEEKFGIEPKTLCKAGKVVETLVATANNFDLVVLGSRGLSRIRRLLMGHVSLKVLENANTNVLIVRNCEAYRKQR
jgi:nucleotide-binding universal stress UspA family protein